MKCAQHFRKPRSKIFAISNRCGLDAPSWIGDRVYGVDRMRGSERSYVCVPGRRRNRDRVEKDDRRTHHRSRPQHMRSPICRRDIVVVRRCGPIFDGRVVCRQKPAPRGFASKSAELAGLRVLLTRHWSSLAPAQIDRSRAFMPMPHGRTSRLTRALGNVPRAAGERGRATGVGSGRVSVRGVESLSAFEASVRRPARRTGESEFTTRRYCALILTPLPFVPFG